MPNHCEHDMVIRGNRSEIERFKEFAKEGEKLLSANKFIPYPQNLREMDEAAAVWSYDSKATEEEKNIAKQNYIEKYGDLADGFNKGGYEWCIANWGTKWGMYDTVVNEETDKMISYSFSCAWSPAEPVFKKMAEMFPKLTFDIKYYEMGVGFQGHMRFKNGALIKDVQDNYRGRRGG